MDNFISYSPALRSDSQLLSVLFKTVYINTYGSEGVTYEFANFIETQFSSHTIKSRVDGTASSLWVAKYKDNPVGAIQVEYTNPCPMNQAIIPEINKLYILRDFFGKGIGQKLMQLAESHLKKNGYDRVWLWVLESNLRAIDFYNKQGYMDIGTAYFQMSQNRYKNKVMIKNL